MCFRPSTQSMASAAPRHWFQPQDEPETQSMPSRWNFVVMNQWKPTRRDQLLSQQCVPAFAMRQSKGAKSSPNDAGTCVEIKLSRRVQITTLRHRRDATFIGYPRHTG